MAAKVERTREDALGGLTARDFALTRVCEMFDPYYGKEKLKEVPVWKPYPGKPQEAAYESKADILGYGGAAGGGKMLRLDEPIPTPTGWTTIGELSPGDEILTEIGGVCKVKAVHEIDNSPIAYKFTFDDGTEIESCQDHLWLTFNARELGKLTKVDLDYRGRKRERRRLQGSKATGNKSELFTSVISARNKRIGEMHVTVRPTGTVRSTKDIYDTIRTKKGRTNHAIPVTRPLDLPDKCLPLNPYLFGIWLGDGTTLAGSVTTVDLEIVRAFAKEFDIGYCYEGKTNNNVQTFNPLKLKTILKDMGVIGNKHIPTNYLRSSYSQRVALLQGLMDSDGYCNKSGRCHFSTTKKSLSDDFYELLMSLGVKVRMIENRATIKRQGVVKDCGPVWEFKWTAAFPVFRLKRKLDRLMLSKSRVTKFRYIVDCVRCKSSPMRCITVDNPTGLFLVGKSMVPTHNTDLLLGLAATKHRRSVIFRRENTQNQGFVDRSREVLSEHGKYDATRGIWRHLPGDRQIELAGVKDQSSVFAWRGRPHDFLGFDEVDAFTEFQFRFLTGWNRTTIVGQRCRIVMTFNPPATAEGRWLLKYFAPWLDKKHSKPAAPGELRWYAMVDNKEIERPNGFPFKHGKETIKPLSRTFIPAAVTDNPLLMATDYPTKLQSLPEPYRSQLLYGDFSAGLADDEWQCIPTKWIELAMERWTEEKPEGQEQTSIGVDVARGGADKTSLAPIYGNYVDRLKKYPGKETPDGRSVAEKVHLIHDGQSYICIDAIAVGSSPVDYLKDHLGDLVIPVNFGAGSDFYDKSGKYKLVNMRAACYWKFREALDPDSGEDIALPPDTELLADLAAPRYKKTPRGIQIEDKDEIKKRLGRSPDSGDSVVTGYSKILLRKEAPQGWFRVLHTRNIKKGYHFILCKSDDVRKLNLDVGVSRILHIYIKPLSNGEQRTIISNRDGIETLTIRVSDLDPKRLPELSDAKLLMGKDEARKAWAFVLKKRMEPINVVVMVEDEGGNRALSMAMALCDGMGLRREETIWQFGKDDKKYTHKDDAPLVRVYDTIKHARSLVMA